jgi:hypothetical protein
MAGNLTEETTRAQRWLTGQKWKLRLHSDYRSRADLQIVTRYIDNVPRELHVVEMKYQPEANDRFDL